MFSVSKPINKNLKDSPGDLDIVIKDTAASISYTKTNKLITALYMVTDIIDKDEPLRNKLRTLGAEIISDIHSRSVNAYNTINQIMSFLDIASAINIISDMNTNILKKEFLELNQSIREFTDKVKNLDRQTNLSEFFSTEIPIEKSKGHPQRDKYQSIGHQSSTRIGVQKGSTLMQALSDKTYMMSDNGFNQNSKTDFGLIKKERRFNIVNAIKNNGGTSTIKDIKLKINNGLSESDICSEKTLQRELVSMIKDGVLDKTGEKRWSKYFIKNQVQSAPSNLA